MEVTIFQTGFRVDAGALQPGDLFRKDDDSLWEVKPDGTQVALGSGGSQPGVLVVRGPFAFAYNTAGLAAGVAFYTPTIGDILHDVWVEIDTAWNGTTPKCDVGTFVGRTSGLFSFAGGVIDMTAADGDHGGTGLLVGTGAAPNGEAAGSGFAGIRGVPALVVAANPLKVAVSEDGTAGGTDPGASQGAGKTYVVTSTPTPF